MINVTLPLVIATQNYNKSLIHDPGPGLSECKSMDFMASPDDMARVEKLFLGFCDRTVQKHDQLAWNQLHKDLEFEDVKIIYNGETRVYSMAYVNANEGTTTGCMAVLDR